MRDLLLGLRPKDFDVATNAHPEEIRDLFRNCRLIGRRFRLAHVRYGRDVIEVATFRASGGGDELADAQHRVSDNGRLLRDNVYGTLEDDVWRRDLSINSLYYNIRDFSVVDFTGGARDLHDGVIRMIGDPQVRYREDPVRMLRALRFAAKLGFAIDPGTQDPIPDLITTLSDIPPARLYDEVLKLFMMGNAVSAFDLLKRHGAFAQLFPATDAFLASDPDGGYDRFLHQAFVNTDERIAEDKPVTPAFLFAALLWAPVKERAQANLADGKSEYEAMDHAGARIVAKQAERVALPKRFSLIARDIWNLQYRLEQQRGRRALGLLELNRFRAAYDFLLLRAQTGEDVGESAEWWTKLQEADEQTRDSMLAPTSRRRRRRRRPKGSPVVKAVDGEWSASKPSSA